MYPFAFKLAVKLDCTTPEITPEIKCYLKGKSNLQSALVEYIAWEISTELLFFIILIMKLCTHMNRQRVFQIKE